MAMPILPPPTRRNFFMGATAFFRGGTVRPAGLGKEAAKRRNSRYDPANRRDFRRNDAPATPLQSRHLLRGGGPASPTRGEAEHGVRFSFPPRGGRWRDERASAKSRRKGGAPVRDTDAKLIALLKANAREPTASLARKLGLARSTVQERIARLERQGAIKGYTVRLSDEAAAGKLRAVVMISTDPQRADSVA